MNTKILRRLHNIGRVIGYLIGMSIYITLMLLTLLGLVRLVEWIGVSN
jgi:hypothetical protein